MIDFVLDDLDYSKFDCGYGVRLIRQWHSLVKIQRIHHSTMLTS
jgi:hypothetical protein